MPRKILFIVTFASLLIAPIFFILGTHKVEAQNGEIPAIEVEAYKVENIEIELSKDLPGRVVASQISQVRPQISGIIIDRLFEEGSYVKKGQQLYQIDPRQFIAEAKKAKADLEFSMSDLSSKKTKFERYKKLLKLDAISKQEFDDIKAEYEKSLADIQAKESILEQAEIKYEYSKVYAPISGKIGKSYVTKGALVGTEQEQPLAVITELNPIYIDTSLPSKDYFEIRNAIKGQDLIKVSLSIPGASTKFSNLGTLKFSESIIEESTGSVSLRCVFSNEASMLLPGLFVKAKLLLGKSKVLVAPQRSVTIDLDGNKKVWVINSKNVVKSKIIQADKPYKNYWIVNKGLQEGDLIISKGYQKVQDNQKVSVVFDKENNRQIDDKKEIKEKEKEKAKIEQKNQNNLKNMQSENYKNDIKNQKKIYELKKDLNNTKNHDFEAESKKNLQHGSDKNLEEEINKINKAFKEKKDKNSYQKEVDRIVKDKIANYKKEFEDSSGFKFVEQKIELSEDGQKNSESQNRKIN